MTLILSSMKQAGFEIFSGAKAMRFESRQAIADIGKGVKTFLCNARSARNTPTSRFG